MTETVNIFGDLEVVVRDAKTHKVLQRFSGRNLLVNNFMRAFGALFADGDASFKITTLKLGTGNTLPTISDTDLENSVFSKECSSIVYNVNTRTITATTTIETTEANGYALQEAGLFSNTNENLTMLARKVFPAINKTVDLTIDFVWRLTVALS